MIEPSLGETNMKPFEVLFFDVNENNKNVSYSADKGSRNKERLDQTLM